MEKKYDFSDFKHGMVGSATRAGFSISGTADFLVVSLRTVFIAYTEWYLKRKKNQNTQHVAILWLQTPLWLRGYQSITHYAGHYDLLSVYIYISGPFDLFL